MTALTLDCPAKINLGLEVLGRRPDGYHALVTIFQALALADTLSVEPAADLTLTCTEPTLSTDDNLSLRAATALRTATGVRLGARLRLVKRVPAAAGLGGGSSDAAATLRLLNQLWGTGLTAADLATLAVGLGADVPFFLDGPTALATGIGEILSPLPPPPPRWLVLVQPNLTLPDKTARLFRALTAADWSDGARTRAQADRLRAGDDLEPALLVNAFTRPLLSAFPAVAATATALQRAGATLVFPAGSGPTLVAPGADEPAAQALAAAVAAPDRTVLVTTTLAAPSPPIAIA